MPTSSPSANLRNPYPLTNHRTQVPLDSEPNGTRVRVISTYFDLVRDISTYFEINKFQRARPGASAVSFLFFRLKTLDFALRTHS